MALNSWVCMLQTDQGGGGVVYWKRPEMLGIREGVLWERSAEKKAVIRVEGTVRTCDGKGKWTEHRDSGLSLGIWQYCQ